MDPRWAYDESLRLNFHYDRIDPNERGWDLPDLECWPEDGYTYEVRHDEGLVYTGSFDDIDRWADDQWTDQIEWY